MMRRRHRRLVAGLTVGSPAVETAPEGTAREVLAWVGDDPQRACTALEAEQAGRQRSSLIAELERLAK
jgi:hypothetical protein